MMSDPMMDPSGSTMEIDFGNLLDEIETVAMQDDDGTLGLGAGSVGSASLNDSAFDSPGKQTRPFPAFGDLSGEKVGDYTRNGGAGAGKIIYGPSTANAPQSSTGSFFIPASSAPILDTAPIFEPQIQFGEIRSTPVQLPASSNASEGSLRRSSVGMRHQMKMMLMKQKMVEDEQKRDPPAVSEAIATSLTSLLTAGSNVVLNNGAANPIYASLPQVNEMRNANVVLAPSSGTANGGGSFTAASTSLPSQPPPIRLSNPTKLFFQKQQERKCMNPGSDESLSQPQPSREGSLTGSPAVADSNFLSVRPRLGPRQSQGSSPSLFRLADGSLGGVSPANDPDIFGSTGTSVSELDDLFEEIGEGTLEKAQPEDVDAITGLLNSSMTMPHSNSLSDLAGSASGNANLTFSASCPNEILAKIQSGDQLTENEMKLYMKDRQKKDNHNQIERRRRFNINDRIKELGTMLPKGSDPEFRANKGSILKATVDYIKKIEGEKEKYRRGEAKEKENGKDYEKLCKTMFLRIQVLEKHAREHGWVVPGGEIDGNSSSLLESLLANNQSTGQGLPQSLPQNQNSSEKVFKVSPSQLSSSTPVVTLSPPEYQGYSVSPQDGRISEQNSVPTNQHATFFNNTQPFQSPSHGVNSQQPHQQMQQMQQNQQTQQNSYPIIQLAQDGGATITFVQCDPAAGNHVLDGGVLKQEPVDQTVGQGMEYGVDCSDFAAMVQGNDAFLVDQANQMFSNSYSPQTFDETVREALDLL